MLLDTDQSPQIVYSFTSIALSVVTSVSETSRMYLSFRLDLTLIFQLGLRVSVYGLSSAYMTVSITQIAIILFENWTLLSLRKGDRFSGKCIFFSCARFGFHPLDTQPN